MSFPILVPELPRRPRIRRGAAHRPSERFLRYPILVLVLVSALSALFLGCGSEEEIGVLSDRFRIVKPASWRRLDLNDIAEVEIGNIFKEAYLVIISERKSEIAADLDARQYASFATANLAEAIRGYKQLKTVEVEYAGYPGLRIGYAGTVDGVKVRYLHYILDVDNAFIQFLFWSTQDRFNGNLKTYSRIMESFAELPPV